MADRSNGSRTPNVQERHSGSRNDLQRQNRPANQERLRQEVDHVDPARYQPNGVQGIGPPYNDLGRLVRPASHEHDDSSGDHSMRRSPYQASSGHDGGSPPRASNQGPHYASPEVDDRRPYQPVDRSSYRAAARQFDSDLGHHHRGEAPTAPRQAHDPMQRFRNETMRDQAWNHMDSYRPVSQPGGARGREQEPSDSVGTSLGVENGSDSSLGRPY